jgi:hypothetical protein
MGLVDLRPKGKETRIPSLHIRVTIANTSEPTPWTFNTKEQTLLFPNYPASTPLYANSDAPGLPELEIKSGELRAVDLFFPLPTKAGSEKEIPEFDFKWLIHSGAVALSETAAFERVPIDNSYPVIYPYEPYPIGYGPMWWDGGYGPAIISPMPNIRIRK